MLAKKKHASREILSFFFFLIIYKEKHGIVTEFDQK